MCHLTILSQTKRKEVESGPKFQIQLLYPQSTLCFQSAENVFKFHFLHPSTSRFSHIPKRAQPSSPPSTLFHISRCPNIFQQLPNDRPRYPCSHAGWLDGLSANEAKIKKGSSLCTLCVRTLGSRQIEKPWIGVWKKICIMEKNGSQQKYWGFGGNRAKKCWIVKAKLEDQSRKMHF